MMLHTKYQGSMPCGFRQEDFLMFSLYKPSGVGPFLPKVHNLNKLGRGPLDTATYLISRL